MQFYMLAALNDMIFDNVQKETLASAAKDYSLLSL